MKQDEGTHIPFPLIIYEKNSDVVASFLDSNRETFEETYSFMATEQAHLEEVTKYLDELKPRIEATKT